jgi:predicted ATP-grasp superfamily ATP-dependent carboligase
MSVRVLITDAEQRAVLGACRGLTRAGYAVSAVASSRPAATHWSRSCTERLRLPDPQDGTAVFAHRLGDILRRTEYAVVMPGTDAALLAISEHREQLEQLTRLGLPTRDVVRRSVDKIRLLEEAAAVGLAPPASVACSSGNEALAAARRLGFPAVLKPAQSFVPVGDRLRRQRIAVVADERALMGTLPRFDAPFIVQRFERARFLLSCTGVVVEGRLLALTTSRVYRMWPPQAGMHTFSETVPPPDGLAARVRALLEAIGWQGVFQFQMLEFDDGRLSVIDLNPRVFASVTLDAAAGANLAAIWCDWLLGRNPLPVTARAGLRYRWEEGELCHLAWQVRHGRLGAAAAVLRPHRKVVYAWFRPDDPAPLVARALSLALRGVKRRASLARIRAPKR